MSGKQNSVLKDVMHFFSETPSNAGSMYVSAVYDSDAFGKISKQVSPVGIALLSSSSYKPKTGCNNDDNTVHPNIAAFLAATAKYHRQIDKSTHSDEVYKTLNARIRKSTVDALTRRVSTLNDKAREELKKNGANDIMSFYDAMVDVSKKHFDDESKKIPPENPNIGALADAFVGYCSKDKADAEYVYAPFKDASGKDASGKLNSKDLDVSANFSKFIKAMEKLGFDNAKTSAISEPNLATAFENGVLSNENVVKIADKAIEFLDSAIKSKFDNPTAAKTNLKKSIIACIAELGHTFKDENSGDIIDKFGTGINVKFSELTSAIQVFELCGFKLNDAGTSAGFAGGAGGPYNDKLKEAHDGKYMGQLCADIFFDLGNPKSVARDLRDVIKNSSSTTAEDDMKTLRIRLTTGIKQIVAEFIDKLYKNPEINYRDSLVNSIVAMFNDAIKQTISSVPHTNAGKPIVDMLIRKVFFNWGDLSSASRDFYKQHLHLLKKVDTQWQSYFDPSNKLSIDDLKTDYPTHEEEFRVNIRKSEPGAVDTLFEATIPLLPSYFKKICIKFDSGAMEELSATPNILKEIYRSVYLDESFDNINGKVGAPDKFIEFEIDDNKFLKNSLRIFNSPDGQRDPVPSLSDVFTDMSTGSMWYQDESSGSKRFYRYDAAQKKKVYEDEEELATDCMGTGLNGSNEEKCKKFVYECILNGDSNGLEFCFDSLVDGDFFKLADKENKF
jgi:hypothetical protein